MAAADCPAAPELEVGELGTVMACRVAVSPRWGWGVWGTEQGPGAEQ